jgi:sulfite reductase (NADPH) flavoprotein alpha-component
MKMTYNRDNPFTARLKFRRRLNDQASDKNVQHIVFDMSNSDISYKCGDSIAVFPKNNGSETAEILRFLKIDPETQVKLSFLGEKISISSALGEYLCITNLSEQFWKWLAEIETNSAMGAFISDKILRSDPECQVLAKSYSLLEILKKFDGHCEVEPDELVSKLRRLTPRLYSIASSPLVDRNEIRVVVGVVSYTNAIGNKRNGIASNYLAHDASIGEGIRVFVVKSMFALPANAESNIIMVGPGTGIAPFRGFLQERQCMAAKGDKVGKSWLFFGDRNRATDFLFEEELQTFKNSGALTNLDLAFSRDQENKIYVQDRIWEHRKELWSWISNGAYVYLCGNASKMAVDVENILKKIAMELGNFAEDEANVFLKSLKDSRRYQRDVY